jgi:putative transcriptional regulator
MSKFGKELIESAHEALAIARGARKAPIRKRLNLSQARFAEAFGLSAATVRDWEQGRRRPDRTASTLLAVIARRPEAVIAALSERGNAGRRAAGR